jgi:hypothetical protein
MQMVFWKLTTHKLLDLGVVGAVVPNILFCYGGQPLPRPG